MREAFAAAACEATGMGAVVVIYTGSQWAGLRARPCEPASRPIVHGWEAGCAGASQLPGGGHPGECLGEVSDEVAWRLEADREAQQTGRDAQSVVDLGFERGVC